MAYDLTIEDTEFMGAVKARIAVIDITSYTSGGEDVSPNDVGLNRIQSVTTYVRDGTNQIAQYDETNEKLRLLESGDGAGELDEVGSGASVSVRFVGKGK